MRTVSRLSLPLVLILFFTGIPQASAQDSPPPNDTVQDSTAQGGTALNLTAGTVGLSIGDSERTTGLRLNYRDHQMRWVHGINATIWHPPYDQARGTVRGLALGVPVTGAMRIHGVAAGAGVGTTETIAGVALAALGLGAGEHLDGIAVGGLGVGAGGSIRGILVAGLGAGAGEHISGVAVSGLGIGSGGSVRGVLVSGVGGGAGDALTGIGVAGIGLGTGGALSGIGIAGIGAGASGGAQGLLAGGVAAGTGGDMTGILVGGLASGAGGRMTGIMAGGLASGASQVRGLALGGIATGARTVHGALVSAGYNRIEEGVMRGVTLSGYNDMRGTQRGIAIGIYNYARTLHGLQIGVLNVAQNNPRGLRVLPLVNANL